MKKQIIKITENKLKQIVNESVKKVLNELDWKTYANAAKKASINGDTRTSKFRDAAISRFNDEYGYENLKSYDGVKNLKAVPANYSDWESWRKNKNNTSPLDAETPHISLNFSYDDNDHFRFDKKGKAITDIDNYPEKPIKTVYDNGGSISFPTEVFPSTDYESSKRNGMAYEEFDNYRKGNYTYQKGKGWIKNN